MKNSISPINFIFLIFIFCSCSNQVENNISKTIDSIFKKENFNPNTQYEPISLFFKGKPILTLGKSIDDIDSTLVFRSDPNLKYQDSSHSITDYLCIDKQLRFEFENSTANLNGVLYFSAEKQKKQIFHITGHWGFMGLSNPTTEKATIDFVENELFPVLKGKFEIKKDWTFEIDKGKYVEFFNLIFTENRIFDWVLNYEIKMSI